MCELGFSRWCDGANLSYNIIMFARSRTFYLAYYHFMELLILESVELDLRGCLCAVRLHVMQLQYILYLSQ